jgi:hypothetical protein
MNFGSPNPFGAPATTGAAAPAFTFLQQDSHLVALQKVMIVSATCFLTLEDSYLRRDKTFTSMLIWRVFLWTELSQFSVFLLELAEDFA